MAPRGQELAVQDANAKSRRALHSGPTSTPPTLRLTVTRFYAWPQRGNCLRLTITRQLRLTLTREDCCGGRTRCVCAPDAAAKLAAEPTAQVGECLCIPSTSLTLALAMPFLYPYWVPRGHRRVPEWPPREGPGARDLVGGKNCPWGENCPTVLGQYSENNSATTATIYKRIDVSERPRAQLAPLIVPIVKSISNFYPQSERRPRRAFAPICS